eukprot:RCo002498
MRRSAEKFHFFWTCRFVGHMLKLQVGGCVSYPKAGRGFLPPWSFWLSDGEPLVFTQIVHHNPFCFYVFFEPFFFAHTMRQQDSRLPCQVRRFCLCLRSSLPLPSLLFSSLLFSSLPPPSLLFSSAPFSSLLFSSLLFSSLLFSSLL